MVYIRHSYDLYNLPFEIEPIDEDGENGYLVRFQDSTGHVVVGIDVPGSVTEGYESAQRWIRHALDRGLRIPGHQKRSRPYLTWIAHRLSRDPVDSPVCNDVIDLLKKVGVEFSRRFSLYIGGSGVMA